MSGFDALATDRHLTPEQWNGALMQIGYFYPDKRGVILRAVSSGIEEVQKRFANAGHRRPPLAVPVKPLEGNWKEYEGRLFYSDVNKGVLATRKWLDQMNALPLDREVMITGHDNQVVLQGRLEDLLALNGAEEADHALWRAEGIQDPPRNTAAEVKWKLADYDAIPIEFRALERQVVIAEGMNMPETPTIALLRQRIENARAAAKRVLGA